MYVLTALVRLVICIGMHPQFCP